MRRGKRITIAPGIYQDGSGLAAKVTLGSGKASRQREQRFPIGTDLYLLEEWQRQTRAELQRERDAGDSPEGIKNIPPVKLPRGTFAADVARYLPQIAGRVSFKADRSHLKAWVPDIGHLLRTKVTPVHVRTAIAAWLTAGKSARTVRHRVRVLRELWRTLDGAAARPPLSGVKLPKPADPNPTPVSIALIQRVAASLKAGKRHAQGYGGDSDVTHARFLVRATTGQRPSQLMRAERGDVDLVRRIWFVRAGKGGRAVPLPLNPDQVRAWKAFITADAWGPFDTRSFSKTIRRHGWPAHVRPYTLRHTFAIDHLLGGTDIGDLQGLLGHRQLETTRKFYAPVLLARLRKVSGSRKLKLA